MNLVEKFDYVALKTWDPENLWIFSLVHLTPRYTWASSLTLWGQLLIFRKKNVHPPHKDHPHHLHATIAASLFFQQKKKILNPKKNNWHENFRGDGFAIRQGSRPLSGSCNCGNFEKEKLHPENVYPDDPSTAVFPPPPDNRLCLLFSTVWFSRSKRSSVLGCFGWCFRYGQKMGETKLNGPFTDTKPKRGIMPEWWEFSACAAPWPGGARAENKARSPLSIWSNSCWKDGVLCKPFSYWHADN